VKEDPEEESGDKVTPIPYTTIVAVGVVVIVVLIQAITRLLRKSDNGSKYYLKKSLQEATNESSYIILVNYIVIICYSVLLHRAIKERRILLIVAGGLPLVLQLALNGVFVFKFLEEVKDEVKSPMYYGFRKNVSALIMIFSVLGTLQTTRFYFGIFVIFNLLPMTIEYSLELRDPLNLCSLIQAGAVHLPVIVCTAIEMIIHSEKTKLYATAVDACAISVLILGILVATSLIDRVCAFKERLLVIEMAQKPAFKTKQRPWKDQKDNSEKLSNNSAGDNNSYSSSQKEYGSDENRPEEAKGSSIIPVHDFFTEQPFNEENKEDFNAEYNGMIQKNKELSEVKEKEEKSLEESESSENKSVEVSNDAKVEAEPEFKKKFPSEVKNHLTKTKKNANVY
jgi:hypothetical protein